MYLPAPQEGETTPIDELGVTVSQIRAKDHGLEDQQTTMLTNWEDLRQEAALDHGAGEITEDQHEFINSRIQYAEIESTYAHYDTVLLDMLYYLRDQEASHSRSYKYAQRMLTEANARRRAGRGHVNRIERPPVLVPPPRRTAHDCCAVQ